MCIGFLLQRGDGNIEWKWQKSREIAGAAGKYSRLTKFFFFHAINFFHTSREEISAFLSENASFICHIIKDFLWMADLVGPDSDNFFWFDNWPLFLQWCQCQWMSLFSHVEFFVLVRSFFVFLYFLSWNWILVFVFRRLDLVSITSFSSSILYSWPSYVNLWTFMKWHHSLNSQEPSTHLRSFLRNLALPLLLFLMVEDIESKPRSSINT